MKTMLSLFFLFLTFTAKPLVGAVDAASDAVLDADGDEVQTGASYYIGSSATIGGSRLTLPRPNPNDTCTIRIIGKLHEDGRPVAISPVKTTESVIRESTDLNFQFSSGPICEPPVSPVWKLNESSGHTFVTIDGVKDNSISWFKIEKYGPARTYKLIYCASAYDSCLVLCRDLGLYEENGANYLVLSDQAFQVSFFKANVKSANKRIFSVI